MNMNHRIVTTCVTILIFTVITNAKLNNDKSVIIRDRDIQEVNTYGLNSNIRSDGISGTLQTGSLRHKLHDGEVEETKAVTESGCDIYGCLNGGTCDTRTKYCFCNSGWAGRYCDLTTIQVDSDFSLQLPLYTGPLLVTYFLSVSYDMKLQITNNPANNTNLEVLLCDPDSMIYWGFQAFEADIYDSKVLQMTFSAPNQLATPIIVLLSHIVTKTCRNIGCFNSGICLPTGKCYCTDSNSYGLFCEYRLMGVHSSISLDLPRTTHNIPITYNVGIGSNITLFIARDSVCDDYTLQMEIYNGSFFGICTSCQPCLVYFEHGIPFYISFVAANPTNKQITVWFYEGRNDRSLAQESGDQRIRSGTARRDQPIGFSVSTSLAPTRSENKRPDVARFREKIVRVMRTHRQQQGQSKQEHQISISPMFTMLSGRDLAFNSEISHVDKVVSGDEQYQPHAQQQGVQIGDQAERLGATALRSTAADHQVAASSYEPVYNRDTKPEEPDIHKNNSKKKHVIVETPKPDQAEKKIKAE